MAAKRGEDHHNAVLTDRDVELLRKMHETGEYTLYDLAVVFGISRSHVHNIVTGRKRC